MGESSAAPVEAQGAPAHPTRALRPVRAFLVFLVLACLVPGLIGAALLAYYEYQSGRRALERNALLTTRALVQAIDSHLFKAQAVAQSLSTSGAIRNGDFSAFHEEARNFLTLNASASAISLSDASAQLVLNTSLNPGEALPRHGNPQQVRRVFETRQPAISNLFRGNVSRQLLVSIDVPVVVDGKVRYVLTAVLRPEIFQAFLQTQELPKDWIAAIFDAEGAFVTRTLSPEQFIGKKPSAELLRQATQANEGVFASVTPDGIPVLTVFSRSPNTGWFVALGIPRTVLEAEYLQPLRLLLIGTLLLFAIGMGLAWWLGERIATSVRALALQAKALGAGEPVLLPRVHIRESHEVASALVEAARLLRARKAALAAERNSREAQLEHLVAERTEALQAAILASERLARSDPLTGLQNRRSAGERLLVEYQRMQRSTQAFAALLLDIDHFKRINDSHGHEAGDTVLREVAQVLQAGIRVTDFVARFGGEEFLILLPKTGAEGARTMAEKIRMAVADNPFSVATGVTISIGVACATMADESQDQVVRRADAALYDAKREGRNRTQLR